MNLQNIILLLSAASVVNGLSSSSPEPNKNNINRRGFVVNTAAAAVVGTGLANTILAPNAAFAELPAEGKKAPTFELPNSRGNGNTSLDSLVESKKWTVLYFYPGAFTSGCTLEARGFQRDLEDYRKLNAQVVGVSVDSVEKNAQFCSEEKLDFYMLSDKGGQVSKLYGSALSVPGFGTFSNRQTYIIDPNGSLRWIFTDVESKIARHSSEVLEKLKELEA
mmetsp:Transcript_48/g.70  ORF Transcript_48/g.70 Transcript_48/m.70 type:complete len:221 (-) Transcript_48:103-765(-)